jgi:mono/diheme cytochrome c family protein
VLAAAVSGCAGKPDYPPDLTFPPRADRLVLRVPTDRQPTATGEPGKLDAELAGLDALGGKTADPNAIADPHRRALDAFLADTFGTPAAPELKGEDAAAGRLGLTPEKLTEGGKLFRRHCLQCHGLSGDGRGPTGLWIYPHPRDFRRGSFKFVLTGDGLKPRRPDLVRTIREGLRGSAMPAFALLAESEQELLAGYAVYLSIRGQVEFQTLAALATAAENETEVEADVAGYARGRLKHVLGEWEKAEAAAAPPAPSIAGDDAGKQAPEYLDSVRRGHALFTAPGQTACITCHEDFGRKPTFRYDVWGTVVRPADLTAGMYKGGNRPEDLASRIRFGISPSGMPAHASLSDAQLADLVRFVRALPYPRELPPDVRSKVYPGQ